MRRPRSPFRASVAGATRATAGGIRGPFRAAAGRDRPSDLARDLVVPAVGDGRQDRGVPEPADLDAVRAQLLALLQERGLRRIAASYSTPAVFIDAETSPEQLVDVVEAIAPAFVSLTVSEFDVDAFTAETEETLAKQRQAISPAGHALIGQHRRRAGKVQDLTLQWVGHGVLYAYFVVADWYSTLEEAVEGSAFERADDDTDDWAVQRARAHQLVLTLEGDSRFRAAPPAMRRASGDRLLDSFLNEDDYELPQLRFIVQEAVRLAAANAADAIAALDLAEVAALPQWRVARTQQARADLAERLLVERTGYGCNRSTADTFRRHVDAATPH